MGDGGYRQGNSWTDLALSRGLPCKRSAGKKSQGYAGYMTLDASVGDNQLLLEAMALDNMGVEGSKNGATQKLESYTKPPTLERIRDEVAE